MKKIVALAALACALATMPSVSQRAYACSTSNCATDDATQVPAATDQTGKTQTACPNAGCATPEPAPTQVAAPCPGYGCARPEPAPTQVATPCPNYGCATPEPAPVQVATTPQRDRPARATASLSPGGAALGKAVRAVKERIRQQRTGCATSNC
jgi:hypothetical protein